MDLEGGDGAMNGIEFVEEFSPTVGGANVYKDCMLRLRKMHADSKKRNEELQKKNAELQRENLELKQQIEMEEDRRENMQMEILIVKGDLNLERNQRLALEEKLRFMTETLWKNRDRGGTAAKGSNSCDSSTSKNTRPSSPSTNSFDVRSSKENQDASSQVMKEKHNNVVSASPTPSDELSDLLDSLSASSTSTKKARPEDSSGIANEFNNTRSSRRAATPKATAAVAPRRTSLRRLSTVAKQMEKEEPKKPPPQGNSKRKNDQKSSLNHCCPPIDVVTQPHTRKRHKEKEVDLETVLPSYDESEEFHLYPEGSLPAPRVVKFVEAKEPSSDVTTVKLQSTNDFVQALQKIMGASGAKKIVSDSP